MSRTLANLLLLFASVIWGTTFVAQKLAMAYLGPLLYTGLRFALGALVIAPLAWREWQRLPPQERTQFPWRATAFLGLLLTGGIVLQQIGVTTTYVGNAGFLTTLYVAFVPLLAWLVWRHRPPWSVLPLVLLTLVGSYLLTGGIAALRPGDGWIVASALFWAVHLIVLARASQRVAAPFLIALGQYLMCTCITTLAGLLIEPWPEVSQLTAVFPMVLYGGLLSVGIAFTLQVVALRHTRPFDAAVLMTSEALFAAVAGALWLAETMHASQWLGGALIAISVVAIQVLMPGEGKDGRRS